MRSCEGVDLFASIQSDLKPWRQRGGISVKDVNAAADSTAVPGWIRVTVVEGELYARNFGTGTITARSKPPTDKSAFTSFEVLSLLKCRLGHTRRAMALDAS